MIAGSHPIYITVLSGASAALWDEAICSDEAENNSERNSKDTRNILTSDKNASETSPPSVTTQLHVTDLPGS